MIELSLSGGLNTGVSPWKLAPGEFVALQNFIPFGEPGQECKLIRRGGFRRLNAFSNRFDFTSVGESVNGGHFYGLLNYRPGNGSAASPTILLAGRTFWGKFDGESTDPITALSTASGISINSLTLPWTMFQYKNIAYGIREGVGAIIRSTGADITTAGIAAPTTAPTIADGGAGSTAAASYSIVVVYLNSETGARSNPSDPSNTLAAAGSKQITATNIPVSPNGQVDSREIYSTLPDGAGEYYLVATISDNVTTTLSFDVDPDQMIDLASFDNGLPDDDFKIGAVWKERLYASNGRDIRYSEIGNVEGFGADSELAISPDDNQQVTGFLPFNEQLLICKTNSTYYLTPGDIAGIPRVLSDKVGCASHHTMRSTENQAFWLGHDDVYRTDGTSVIGVGNVKIRDFLSALDADEFKRTSAVIYPKLYLYVIRFPDFARIPLGSNGTTSAYLAYNYLRNTWCSITAEDLPVTIADYTTEDGDFRIYGSLDGSVYHLFDDSRGWDDERSSDSENDIPAYIETGPLIRNSPGTTQIIKRIWVLSDQEQAEFTAQYRVDRDGLTTGRTVSLDVASPWKPYAVAQYKAATETRLCITYTGRPQWVIEGLGFDGWSTSRTKMPT